MSAIPTGRSETQPLMASVSAVPAPGRTLTPDEVFAAAEKAYRVYFDNVAKTTGPVDLTQAQPDLLKGIELYTQYLNFRAGEQQKADTASLHMGTLKRVLGYWIHFHAEKEYQSTYFRDQSTSGFVYLLLGITCCCVPFLAAPCVCYYRSLNTDKRNASYQQANQWLNEAKTAVFTTYGQSNDVKLKAKAAAELALIVEQLGDHPTAVAYADTAIRLDPDLIEAQVTRERLSQSAQQRQTDQVTAGLRNVANEVAALRMAI